MCAGEKGKSDVVAPTSALDQVSIPLLQCSIGDLPHVADCGHTCTTQSLYTWTEIFDDEASTSL